MARKIAFVWLWPNVEERKKVRNTENGANSVYEGHVKRKKRKQKKARAFRNCKQVRKRKESKQVRSEYSSSPVLGIQSSINKFMQLCAYLVYL